MTDKKYYEDLTDEELKARIEDLEKECETLKQELEQYADRVKRLNKDIGAYGDDLE